MLLMFTVQLTLFQCSRVSNKEGTMHAKILKSMPYPHYRFTYILLRPTQCLLLLHFYQILQTSIENA